MKTSIFIAAFVALASATPSIKGLRRNDVQKRAPVFTNQTYNDLSISGGVAGNALAEAEAKLAGLPTDLTTVDPADITFLKAVNSICNDAENGAFNKAIVAAGAGNVTLALQVRTLDVKSHAAKEILTHPDSQRGKIKNKVLKLMATVTSLQIQQAQGKNVTAKLDAETKKLNKNVGEDEAEAGKASTLLKFEATTADPEGSAVAEDDTIATQAGDIVDASS